MNYTVLLTLILQLLVPMVLTSFGNSSTKMGLMNNCSFEHNLCNKTGRDISREQKLKKIVDRYPVLHSFFTDGTVFEAGEPPGDFTRDGVINLVPYEEYRSVCWTEDVTYVPSEVKTVDSVRKIIVNDDTNKQVVKVKICRKSRYKNHCTSLTGFDSYREARCEQRWSTIILLAIDEETETLEHVRVKIPSACVCTVKHTEH
ncbi:uncharacterized protein LOC135129198 [Zophobas morio]|uniref:uncharacterized protein LOC135129198 n=1 Tax=Zophobas morio TaxID=2755281 RepID=UPI003083126D